MSLNGSAIGLAASTGIIAGVGSKYIPNARPEGSKPVMTGGISAASSLLVSLTGVEQTLQGYYPGASAMIVSSRSLIDGIVFALFEAAKDSGNRSAKRAFYNVLLQTGSSAIGQQLSPLVPVPGMMLRKQIPQQPLQTGSLTNPSTLASPGF